MREIPRERFVPAAKRALAYAEIPRRGRARPLPARSADLRQAGCSWRIWRRRTRFSMSAAPPAIRRPCWRRLGQVGQRPGAGCRSGADGHRHAAGGRRAPTSKWCRAAWSTATSRGAPYDADPDRWRGGGRAGGAAGPAWPKAAGSSPSSSRAPRAGPISMCASSGHVGEPAGFRCHGPAAGGIPQAGWICVLESPHQARGGQPSGRGYADEQISAGAAPCVAGAGGAVLAAEPAQAETFTLNEALGVTYETNPQLDAQRAALRATDEDVAKANAGWRPSDQRPRANTAPSITNFPGRAFPRAASRMPIPCRGR